MVEVEMRKSVMHVDMHYPKNIRTVPSVFCLIVQTDSCMKTRWQGITIEHKQYRSILIGIFMRMTAVVLIDEIIMINVCF